MSLLFPNCKNQQYTLKVVTNFLSIENKFDFRKRLTIEEALAHPWLNVSKTSYKHDITLEIQ